MRSTYILSPVPAASPLRSNLVTRQRPLARPEAGCAAAPLRFWSLLFRRSKALAFPSRSLFKYVSSSSSQGLLNPSTEHKFISKMFCETRSSGQMWPICERFMQPSGETFAPMFKNQSVGDLFASAYYDGRHLSPFLGLSLSLSRGHRRYPFLLSFSGSWGCRRRGNSGKERIESGGNYT